VVKPDKPLDFLIEKLSKAPMKRIFLVGLPGSGKKHFVRNIHEHFGVEIIETTKMLKREVQRKTEHAAAIQAAFKNLEFGKPPPPLLNRLFSG